MQISGFCKREPKKRNLSAIIKIFEIKSWLIKAFFVFLQNKRRSRVVMTFGASLICPTYESGKSAFLKILGPQGR